MKSKLSIKFWNLLSGRYFYLTHKCVPIFISLIDKTEEAVFPTKSCLRILITLSWGAFLGDFYEGRLSGYLKRLSAEGIKDILAHYVFFLTELCSYQGVWLEASNLGYVITDDAVRDGINLVMPHVDVLQKEYSFKSLEEVIDASSRLYLGLYVLIEREIGKTVKLEKVGIDPLYFGFYHPDILNESVKIIRSELPEELKKLWVHIVRRSSGDTRRNPN